MASIFTRIISGEIPCYKVAETNSCFAFLDISPLKKGHLLVVPKIEVDQLFDLDEITYNELFDFTHNLAHALKKAMPCDRISMHVIGLEVPHAHIHLVPINSMNDCNFANPKLKLSTEEFIQIAESIKAQL